ncbi:MAG TPA: PTS transporter subunit EIIC [Candidatus Baltobacteraceae bacterium]|nr:PTS transporter subunit EIIC [Candidatus Baltobacteraceae bacterium]
MSRSSAAWRLWSENSSALRKFGDAPALVAVREALPWSIAGLVAGLLAFMALVPVREPFFASLLRRISLAELPSFGVMAFVLVPILAQRLAVRLELTRVAVVAASSIVFVLALPRPVTLSEPLAYLGRVGQSGLFLAIIVSLLLTGACLLARRLISNGLLADVAASAAAILLVVLLFDIHVSLGNALIAALAPMARLGDTYAALLAITIAETVLWILGIHGPATLAAIVTPVYLALQQQNTAAFAVHQPLPHIVVVSLFLFIFPGGAGATLPLAVLLALSKVERLRRIGRITVLPAIFNINEPLVFGLPIVFNPFFALPFVLVPVILATTTYFAVASGLVARPAIWVPSSIPTFASTFLATSDWRAPALVLVNLLLATLMYIPFVRAYERHETRAAA